nr:AAA family ATPase [Methylobacterium radiotolerans]
MTRLPDSAYGPAASERVYATLRQEAGRVLAAGHAAVADAVFDRPAERAAIEAVAGARGARFCGVWLEAPAADLARRIAARTGGPSGATAAAQVARGSGSVAWHRLAADRPLPALSADVLFLCARLGATGLAPPAISPAPIRRVPAD